MEGEGKGWGMSKPESEMLGSSGGCRSRFLGWMWEMSWEANPVFSEASKSCLSFWNSANSWSSRSLSFSKVEMMTFRSLIEFCDHSLVFLCLFSSSFKFFLTF